MSKVKASSETVEEVASEPFKLELPEAINPAAWQTVMLPRNKQAMIYQVGYEHVTPSGTALPRKAYDCFVVSRKSLRTSNGDVSYRYQSRQRFEDLPALKHYLYDLVATLSVKKTTRKLVNVQDLTEVDDD